MTINFSLRIKQP